MTPEQAQGYLLGLQSRGIKLDLDRMRAALRDLGHPERAFPVVLVTGTNGKGSTASALAAIYRAAGRRTGLFSSPHLVDYRERIRIDGRMIRPGELAAQVDRHRAVWERHDLTFFEVGAAMALTAFRDASVDVAVLEIGLGGRLDATNTTEPCLSVVTSLGLDHVHVLGATVAEIAREKAGIFRPGVPALVQGGAGVATLRAEAGRVGAPFHRRRDLVRVENIEVTSDFGMRFRLLGRTPALGLPSAGLELRTAVFGQHQVANATLAALAARLPGSIADPPDWDAVVRGLAAWRWPGRFDAPVPGLPLLFDAGHNPHAGRRIARALRARLDGRRLELVVGMVAKKDHYGFLRPLRPFTDRVRLALPSSERAADRGELDAAARRAGFEVEWWDGIGGALDAALEAARPSPATVTSLPPSGPESREGLVLLAGSLFVLEDGYRHLGLAPAEEI